MNKINYQKEMENIIKSLGFKPRLLLHSCCAPCSSYVIKYLKEYFELTIFFYNPNIDIPGEFLKRYEEQKRFVIEFVRDENIKLICKDEEAKVFYDKVRGLEKEKEGGLRCKECYDLRLLKTAIFAKENSFDYFASTLSISPLKNSQYLNELGYRIEEKLGIKWLPNDFKKKNGYKESVQLSNQYNLYRQDFCGCSFSKNNSKS